MPNEIVWHLIDGRSCIDVLRSKEPTDCINREQRADIMRRTATAIGSRRVQPELALDPSELRRDVFESLFPFDLYPLVVGMLDVRILPHAPKRLAEAIGIRVNVLKAGGLGADVSLAKDVVFVAADGKDLSAFVLDFDPAHRFAEVTGSVVKFAHERGAPVVGASMAPVRKSRSAAM